MSQQINLYTAQYPPPKKIKIPFKYILLGTIIIGLSGAGGTLAFLEIETKKDQLAIEKKLLNTATKNIRNLKNLRNNSTGDRIKLELIALQDVIRRKKGMANKMKEQVNFTAQGFSERYIALSRQDVRGLWLKSIEFDSSTGSVTLRGASVSATLLTDYLNQLSNEESFNGVSFSVFKIDETQKTENSDRKFMDFVVSTHEVGPEVNSLAALLKQ